MSGSFSSSRFIRLYYTPPPATDESAEAEADMDKMMFLIVKRQWRQHQEQLTALFAVCGHKQNYFVDQASFLAWYVMRSQVRACMCVCVCASGRTDSNTTCSEHMQSEGYK